MGISFIGVLRILGLALASLVVFALPALWAATALWFQAPGGTALRHAAVVVWVLFALGMLVMAWAGRPALAVVVFAFAWAGLLAWWQSIPPSNDRRWADDVAQMTHGDIDGDHVTLYKVRNFDWRTPTDYEQRWETRSYDLKKLKSADMILSYWAGPAIAHMLISFGFEDGQYVSFTVEIRREREEAFSEIGGFFKEFELSIIACDERDVVRVRTNVRGEDAYLYRLRMPREAMRGLFLGYVGEANGLIETPRWYNTITANCTTLVYHMMKRIIGHLPFDMRVLFTGYVAGYVYKVGGLDLRFPLERLKELGHITLRAKQSDRSESFSSDIRQGIPALPEAISAP